MKTHVHQQNQAIKYSLNQPVENKQESEDVNLQSQVHILKKENSDLKNLLEEEKKKSPLGERPLDRVEVPERLNYPKQGAQKKPRMRRVRRFRSH